MQTLTGTSRSDRADPEVIAHAFVGKAAWTEAVVHGLEVTALCGTRLIPSRDAAGLPRCVTCLRIVDSVS